MKNIKGIILAGGKGQRLWPTTLSVSKQLLPVYDKPLVYYPLTTLMIAGIRDIMIITTEREQEKFKNLLGDGSKWGLNFQYCIQDKPRGIVDAFIIAENFIDSSEVALILGDNIFYGSGLSNLLMNSIDNHKDATIFSYYVNDPKNYGVCNFDKQNNLVEIIEKPKTYISNWVVTGLYLYNNEVTDVAKKIKPSKRGELEITDLNNYFLKNNRLNCCKLNRGYAWLDAGSPKSLLDASIFVETVESRQGLKIGCPEEIAYRMNFITKKELENIIDNIKHLEYSKYLIKIFNL